MNDQEAAKAITGRKVAMGFLLGILMHAYLLLLVAIGLVAQSVLPEWISIAGLYAVWNPGATQLLYEIPLIIYLRRRREPGIVRGVLIAMGITILLNSAGWVLVLHVLF